jgi:hypothetical protein
MGRAHTTIDMSGARVMRSGSEVGRRAAVPADRRSMSATAEVTAAASGMAAATVALRECRHRNCEDRPQHTDAEKNTLALAHHDCLLNLSRLCRDLIKPFNR